MELRRSLGTHQDSSFCEEFDSWSCPHPLADFLRHSLMIRVRSFHFTVMLSISCTSYVRRNPRLCLQDETFLYAFFAGIINVPELSEVTKLFLTVHSKKTDVILDLVHAGF